MAMGSKARWPSPRFSRYQAHPNIRTASAMRSVTESKKAPRTDAVPAALATGPSNKAGMPALIRKMMAMWRCPDATRTAVAVADTRPVAVSTSAVMPWRCSVSPTGPVVRSTAVRQRPSNMKLLVVRGPGQGSGAVRHEVTIRPRKPGAPTARGERPLRPTPCPPWAAGRVREAWSTAPSGRGESNRGRPLARSEQCDISATSTAEDLHALHPKDRLRAAGRTGRRLGRRRRGRAGGRVHQHDHRQGRRDRLPHRALQELLQG